MSAVAGAGAVIDDVCAIACIAFQLVKRSDQDKSCGIAIANSSGEKLVHPKRYTESGRGDTGNNKIRGKMGENVLSGENGIDTLFGRGGWG